MLDTAVNRILPSGAGASPARGSLLGRLAAAVAVRVATRSVPGALVIGGGLLAKTLFDRRRGKRAAPAAGEAAVDKLAEKGGADASDA
ncbi:MAG: hypothetical protein ACKOQ3_05485 [Novosphingobium sp.]